MFNRNWGNDRRRFQRLSVNLSAWFKVDSPLHVRSLVGEEEVEATTLDLSEGGMSLLTKYNIPAWTTLLIKFVLFRTDKQGLVSFSAPVETLGEVNSNIPVENSLYRLGVKFRQINREDRCEIANAVEATYQPY